MFRILIGCAAFFSLAAPAQAISTPPVGWQTPHVRYPGLEQLTYKFGPIDIKPGQNSINWSPPMTGPRIPGFITRFEPLLIDVRTGRPAPGTVLHLHHNHWKINNTAAFPAGAEKTIFQYPRGFGYPLKGGDQWRMNYMIHNLTPAPHRVYLAWKLDYLPSASPASKAMKPISVRWMDVVGSKLYPVFNAYSGQGSKGRFTFPDQATRKQRRGLGGMNNWRVERDVTLVHTSSHIHPGGVYSSLYVSRGGKRRMLFRSKAVYFNRRTAASWDMATTATPPSWRIKLRRGDRVYMSTTVDTDGVSWRDSMGDFPIAVADGHGVGGVDPFAKGSSWPRSGQVTHGPLPDNSWAGGLPSSAPDPRSLPSGPTLDGPVLIKGFRYQIGGQYNPGVTALPPVVPRGGRLTFVNLDSTRSSSLTDSIYHTITACRAPCNASTGLAYPIEDGPRNFDSDTLGFSQGSFSQTNTPPAAGRNHWSTPDNLAPGTYTYFCRIHPFMRGSFRVARSSGPAPLSAGWESLPEGQSIPSA